MMEQFNSSLLNALFWSLNKFLILTFFIPFFKNVFSGIFGGKKMKKDSKVDLQVPARMSCSFGGTGNQSCPQ